MNTEAIKELKRLADQCICHPVSRSIGEVEQAGEAIKSLIAQLEAAQAELAAIRSMYKQEHTARVNCMDMRKEICDSYEETKAELAAIRALEPAVWANPYGGFLSDHYMKNFATGLEKQTHTVPLYALPEQK